MGTPFRGTVARLREVGTVITWLVLLTSRFRSQAYSEADDNSLGNEGLEALCQKQDEA